MSRIKEFNLFELDKDTGEVKPLVSKVVHEGSILGKGWFVMYDKAIDTLLDEDAPPTVWKLYFKLVRMHGYEPELRCQKKWLMEELGITSRAFYSALKWLKEHHFITETQTMGQSAFVLNPTFASRGTKSIKTRKALWSLSAHQ